MESCELLTFLARDDRKCACGPRCARTADAPSAGYLVRVGVAPERQVSGGRGVAKQRQGREAAERRRSGGGRGTAEWRRGLSAAERRRGRAAAEQRRGPTAKRWRSGGGASTGRGRSGGETMAQRRRSDGRAMAGRHRQLRNARTRAADEGRVSGSRSARQRRASGAEAARQRGAPEQRPGGGGAALERRASGTEWGRSGGRATPEHNGEGGAREQGVSASRDPTHLHDGDFHTSKTSPRLAFEGSGRLSSGPGCHAAPKAAAPKNPNREVVPGSGTTCGCREATRISLLRSPGHSAPSPASRYLEPIGCSVGAKRISASFTNDFQAVHAPSATRP